MMFDLNMFLNVWNPNYANGVENNHSNQVVTPPYQDIDSLDRLMIKKAYVV